MKLNTTVCQAHWVCAWCCRVGAAASGQSYGEPEDHGKRERRVDGAGVEAKRALGGLTGLHAGSLTGQGTVAGAAGCTQDNSATQAQSCQ